MFFIHIYWKQWEEYSFYSCKADLKVVFKLKHDGRLSKMATDTITSHLLQCGSEHSALSWG